MSGTGAAQRDMELWKNWDQGGRRPDDLEPLLDKLDPLINSHVQQYIRVNIPPEALRSKAEDLAIHGIKTFDPGKGAQLSTHIYNNLRGLNRFVTTYQNPARIPQHQVHHISSMLAMRDKMTGELGKPPTDFALAKKLNWSPRQVTSLQKGLTHRALDPELFKLTDPRSYEPSRFNEVINLLPNQLEPRQKLVFQGTYGIGGPMRSSTQMAKKLKVSPATISRLRKQVANEIERFLNT